MCLRLWFGAGRVQREVREDHANTNATTHATQANATTETTTAVHVHKREMYSIGNRHQLHHLHVLLRGPTHRCLCRSAVQ